MRVKPNRTVPESTSGGGGGGGVTIHNDLLERDVAGCHPSGSITNASGVAGASVTNALNNLNTYAGYSGRVTKTIYVDGNRVDVYTENGSRARPYKTFASAVAAISGDGFSIELSPGTYAGNMNIAHNVSLRGSARGNVVLSGDITINKGDCVLQGISFSGALTFADGACTISDCQASGGVTVSGDAEIDGYVFNMSRLNGTALTYASTSTSQLIDSEIESTGNNATITHTNGILILVSCQTQGANAIGPVINSSSNGIINISLGSCFNLGGLQAISCSNGASTSIPNSFVGLLAGGTIVCGNVVTVVEGIQWSALNPGTGITGTNLIYRPASMLANDSLVTGATVKDALDYLLTQIDTTGTNTFETLCVKEKLGVGYDDCSGLIATFNVLNTSSENVYIYRYQDSSAGANIKFFKARGTVDSPVEPNLGDRAGYIEGNIWARNSANDDYDWIRLGKVEFTVDDLDSTGRVGGAFTIFTEFPGSVNAYEHFRVSSVGHVGINDNDPSSDILSIKGYYPTSELPSISLHRTYDAVIDGTVIGAIRFRADDPSTGTIGAQIAVVSTGTWDGAGQPCDFIFHANGTGTYQQRARIGDDGITLPPSYVATAGNQYPSRKLVYKAEVWDETNLQSEVRQMYWQLNAGSGTDTNEPYYLSLYDNDGNEQIRFDPLGTVGLPMAFFPEYIAHLDDPNTAIKFASDRISIYAGSVCYFDMYETAQDVLYIGNGALGTGEDVDIYMGTNNAIFIEGSSGNMTFNTPVIEGFTLGQGSNVNAFDMSVPIDSTATEYSYLLQLDGTAYIEISAYPDGLGGTQHQRTRFWKTGIFEKTGIATGVSDYYDSYELQFKGSCWNTGTASAEDKIARMKMQAEPGTQPPYKLIMMNNEGERCFTFDMTDKGTLVVGKDWGGTYSSLAGLFYRDWSTGHVLRVHNIHTGDTAYAALQVENDASHGLEVGVAATGRGDNWDDKCFIYAFGSTDIRFGDAGGAIASFQAGSGIRIQPGLAITENPSSPLDVRIASAVTPPALSAYNVGLFVGATDASISIISANTKTGYIFFGDTDGQGAGWIGHNHNTNRMEFAILGTARARLSNTGLAISPNANFAPVTALDVRSTNYVTPSTLSADIVANFSGPTSNNTGIAITSQDEREGRIYFGDSTSHDRAIILFNHDELNHKFVTLGAEKLRVSQNGVAIGTSIISDPVYELDVLGDMGLNEYIYHNGDSDTYIRLQDDDMRIFAGGVAFIQMTEAADDYLYLGTASDVDVLLGQSVSMMVEGSSGNIVIGAAISSPKCRLEVRRGTLVPPALLGATVASFSATTNAQISIIASNTTNSRIYFGDTDQETTGCLAYSHSLNYFTITTNNTYNLTLRPAGGTLHLPTFEGSVNDEASITLPDGLSGFLFVNFNEGAEWAIVTFTDGAVPFLIAQSSGNIVTTDTDGYYCILDTGTQLAIKNRSGGAKNIKYFSFCG